MGCQIEILKKLKKENTIACDEMLKIADAFQTASGKGLQSEKQRACCTF